MRPIDADVQPVLFVVISEMGVDWLKHAFITKFNHIRASVYGRYADVLAKDVLAAGNFGGSSRRGKMRNVSYTCLTHRSKEGDGLIRSIHSFLINRPLLLVDSGSHLSRSLAW